MMSHWRFSHPLPLPVPHPLIYSTRQSASALTPEGLVVENELVERPRGWHARDDCLIERTQHACNGLCASKVVWGVRVGGGGETRENAEHRQ